MKAWQFIWRSFLGVPGAVQGLERAPVKAPFERENFGCFRVFALSCIMQTPFHGFGTAVQERDMGRPGTSVLRVSANAASAGCRYTAVSWASNQIPKSPSKYALTTESGAKPPVSVAVWLMPSRTAAEFFIHGHHPGTPRTGMVKYGGFLLWRHAAAGIQALEPRFRLR